MLAPLATSLNLALVGTPNSGKTSLFNALTGSRQRAANYPGVTVERKSGTIQTAAGRTCRLIDLPGTYSLRGRSPDEEITREVVFGELTGEKTPDCIVCVADATNLRLSFRLRAGAEAGRPADAAGAQHDRPRPPPRHRLRSRPAVARNSAFPL